MSNVVSIWCRSQKDSIIGKNIPWDEPEDKKNFRDIVKNKTMVMGRKTYESIEPCLLETNKIYVMSQNSEYEVINPKYHKLISSQKELKDEEDDIYVVGGSFIYELFFRGKEALKPHIVIDCVYEGDIIDGEGDVVDVSNLANDLNLFYRRITPFYKKGNVKSAIWIKKGEFVEQSILKEVVSILEKDAEVL